MSCSVLGGFMGVYNSRLFRVSMKCYAWCVEGGGFRVVLSRAIRTLSGFEGSRAYRV